MDLAERQVVAQERIAVALERLVELFAAEPEPEPEPLAGCPHPVEARVDLTSGDGVPEFECAVCRTRVRLELG